MWLLIVLADALAGAVAAEGDRGGYAVVVSRAAYEDLQWRQVVQTLVDKHRARVVTFRDRVEESLAVLRERIPRYVCFVARPAEATREFVARTNRLVRQLNDDPYADAFWGILTGYDAANARRIAQIKKPLVIRRAAAGTEIELSACEEGIWYCELNQGKMVRKVPGGKPESLRAPADTTKALVDALNEYQAQLFVTSGHATERDWQIGYRFRSGQFRCEAGQIFGVDTAGGRHPVRSDNPKVYLAVGNCLMGHIDGADAMALAWINGAGACQMVGYTVPTWYGYAGWGLCDYFVEQPGRFSLAEAFLANQQALIHRLETCFPGLNADARVGLRRGVLPQRARDAGLTWRDAEGLLYDRDSIAFYGDPGWEARLAPGPAAWEQSLTETGGVHSLEIRPLRGDRSFQPANTNGSQRGGRPIVQVLPRAVDPKQVAILEGGEWEPVVTRCLVLVPAPGKRAKTGPFRVAFRVPPSSTARCCVRD